MRKVSARTQVHHWTAYFDYLRPRYNAGIWARVKRQMPLLSLIASYCTTTLITSGPAPRASYPSSFRSFARNSVSRVIFHTLLYERQWDQMLAKSENTFFKLLKFHNNFPYRIPLSKLKNYGEEQIWKNLKKVYIYS